jgi:hypothetical protein
MSLELVPTSGIFLAAATTLLCSVRFYWALITSFGADGGHYAMFFVVTALTNIFFHPLSSFPGS